MVLWQTESFYFSYINNFRKSFLKISFDCSMGNFISFYFLKNIKIVTSRTRQSPILEVRWGLAIVRSMIVKDRSGRSSSCTPITTIKSNPSSVFKNVFDNTIGAVHKGPGPLRCILIPKRLFRPLVLLANEQNVSPPHHCSPHPTETSVKPARPIKIGFDQRTGKYSNYLLLFHGLFKVHNLKGLFGD